jgi:hypothetical protein
LSEWVSEWGVGEWGGRDSAWWINHYSSDCCIQKINQIVSEWVSEWVSECVSEWEETGVGMMCECVTVWLVVTLPAPGTNKAYTTSSSSSVKRWNELIMGTTLHMRLPYCDIRADLSSWRKSHKNDIA